MVGDCPFTARCIIVRINHAYRTVETSSLSAIFIKSCMYTIVSYPNTIYYSISVYVNGSSVIVGTTGMCARLSIVNTKFIVLHAALRVTQ